MSRKRSGWDFFWYAMYAFAGLGLEMVLLGVVEPLLFGGISGSDYSTWQKILHWVMTMLCWGVIHILSKGSIYDGLGVMVFSLLYGTIYLLLKRNAKWSYPAMALAFMV